MRGELNFVEGNFFEFDTWLIGSKNIYFVERNILKSERKTNILNMHVTRNIYTEEE